MLSDTDPVQTRADDERAVAEPTAAVEPTADEQIAADPAAAGPTAAMSYTVPVSLDPVRSAVSDVWETQHIVGEDDGERFMPALAAASSVVATAAVAMDGERLTLADVPFQFLRVEVNEHGRPKPATPSTGTAFETAFGSSPMGHMGQLSEYVAARRRGHADTTVRAGVWHHPQHPASYRADYPCSVDNMDCERLVADLEDVNDLLDRDFTRWVLWAGFARPPADAGAPAAATDGDEAAPSPAEDKTPEDAPDPAFASRRRIMNVKDLLEVLDEARQRLATASPKRPSDSDRGDADVDTDATPSKTYITPICFIVAVSYKCRFRTADVPPVSKASGHMMLAPPLSSTLTFFTNLINLSSQADSPDSSCSGSDAGNTHEGDFSSIGDYDYDDDDDDDDDNGGDGDGDDSVTDAHHHHRRRAARARNRDAADNVTVEDELGFDYDDIDDDDDYCHGGSILRWDMDGKPYYEWIEDPREYRKALVEKFAMYEKGFGTKPETTPILSFERFHGQDDLAEDDGDDASSGPQATPEDSCVSDSGDDKGKGREEVPGAKHDAKRPKSPAPSSLPPPPSKPRSILETLDTNAAKGDAVEGDLHALLPEAQSPSVEAWRACCELLCIHPDEHKDAQARSVKVPGTDNMWVKPSQLWTAYWMLASRLDRGLCGGVLADVMGTGKTYICLLVCLLRAYISYNRAEVEREWQLRDHEAAKKGGGGGSGNAAPKQHMPRNMASTDGRRTPCPCGNAMGIECYANPGGITRRLADTMARGAALILAPPTVLDNWVKTVKQVRLQHKYYEPVVFSAKMTKEDTVLAPAPRLKQKLQMDVRPQPHVSSDGLFPAAWQPDVRDVVHAFRPSVAKDAYPERFILLATHMPERLTEFFQLPVPLRRKAGAGDGTGVTRERKTVYGCPVGIQLVDEFHKAKDDVVALALQHKHLQSSSAQGVDNFDFWAVTGTPLPAKLTDLESIVEVVQRLPAWDDPSSRHHGGRVVDLRELHVAYEKAVAEDGTPEQVAEFRRRAQRFFAGGLVKRHTEVSTFFGQRIFDLQDVTAQVVAHKTPACRRADVARVVACVGTKLRAAMADAAASSSSSSSLGSTASSPNWEQAVRSASLFNHMMDLEILATFPGAAPLMLADPPLIDFGLAAMRAEIRQAEDRDVTKIALFAKHLDTVIADSPHLQAILATLDCMDSDRTRRKALPPPAAVDRTARSDRSALPPRKKVDAALKKLVVLCPRMGEAVFVYLALRKLRPDAHAVFLHADLRLAERTALLRDFNRLDAVTPAGVNLSARVLVGTFRDAGTGNDLTVANYQILTGPLRLRSQQDQAFGRTNREGQSLCLHHRLLVADDNPVDRIVMATQAHRRIVSDPFDMDAPLQLTAVEDEGEGKGEGEARETTT